MGPMGQRRVAISANGSRGIRNGLGENIRLPECEAQQQYCTQDCLGNADHRFVLALVWLGEDPARKRIYRYFDGALRAFPKDTVEGRFSERGTPRQPIF